MIRGVTLAICLFAMASMTLAAAPPAPVSLRVEHLENPLGIDAANPRFSWVLPQYGRDQRQTAYQIVVTSGGRTVWDSGKVESANSVGVRYAGPALASGAAYEWKVRWWDKTGEASPYSRPARFEMGLLAPGDWTAKWIAGGNQLRKEFRLDARPVRARAYVSGLGYYELRINGRKVGDHVLDPGWTTYDKRVLYVTYDVTDRLRAGDNAVGLILGQGWYGKREALLELVVELEGGRTVRIVTDGSWKTTQGPILADSIYNGETYDATKETPGWDRPGFDDSGWPPARVVEGPGGKLSAQMMPPIKVVETLYPRRLMNPKPGVWVFDLGQNISGWVQLRVKGPRGTKVRIRHAELIYDDGTLNTENLRRAKATDYYILRGDPDGEVWEPRFTYHGFRYVELTGYPGTPSLDSIRGRVVHTAVRQTGAFSASKQILNDIQKIILWGTRTNLHSVPTDCDQRDERMGWMADAHLASETAMVNFDMAAFYENFLRLMRDEQSEDGAVTDTVPHKWGRRPADPAWGSAYPLIAWYLYKHYGDRAVLEEHYEGLKAWADFLDSKAEDHIVEYSYYGDWVPVEKTPGPLVSTFYYYWSTRIVARAARVLGKDADADTYERRAAQIREAFHRRFYRPETGDYGNGSQASNVLALYLDLAPKQARGGANRSLYWDIVYRHNTHLTTGILATKYLMPLLTRTGRADLAYELAAQTTYPSWGYMVKRGATTLWELWQEKTGPSMNSHNHPMFGSVGVWYYEALAGLAPDEDEPGYRRIVVRPQVVRDLRWASGSIETPYGRAASSWRRTADGLRLDLEIPVGAVAEVYVPTLNKDDPVILESGKVIWRNGAFQPGAAEGVRSGRREGRAVVLELGSGIYRIELRGE